MFTDGKELWGSGNLLPPFATEAKDGVPRDFRGRSDFHPRYERFSSWYSCSVLMLQILSLPCVPRTMLSTDSMAVSMEWS